MVEAIYSLTSKTNGIYKDNSNLYFSSRLNRINKVGMFEYENGGSALAFNFQNATNEVFVQILDSGKESDFILANFNKYNPVNRNKPSISFRSLNTGE